MPHAILNGEDVELPAVGMLLDWLRDRGLTGAKPGCRGGDCGACQVLLGEVDPDTSLPRYRTVNSCLIGLDQVADHHVITVEGLTPAAGAPSAPSGAPLSPVQRALAEAGAIQCGYCTPGLVVALTGALLAGEQLETGAAGNLCRCTGYAGIRRTIGALADPTDGALTLHQAADHGLLPRVVAEAGDRMRAPLLASPLRASPVAGARPVGGGTDLGVGHAYEADPGPRLYVRRVPGLRTIMAEEDSIVVGAAVTVAELQESPILASSWPEVAGFLELFGSPAIRHVATVGGNLANASPVADLAVVLLALGADLALEGSAGSRELPLASFFLDYRRTALAPGDLISAVRIPGNADRTARLHAEKVSRRTHDDIATVTSAIVATGGAADRIGDIRLAAGGVSPVPLLLPATARALSGRYLTDDLRDALDLIDEEIAPIDDVRGTARYKARLLRHIVLAHLAALHPRLDPGRYLR